MPTLRRLAAYAMMAAALLCLALFGACSALPTLVPDMSRHGATSVQLESANGPLSPARSKAILERIESGGAGTDIFDLHLRVEEAIAGSPLVTGNKVELLQNASQTYESMMEAIAGARDHINVETYIFDDEEVGQRFADVLIARQRDGVQVNLIRDSVGTITTPDEFFTRLSDAGINVLEFNPINPLTAKAGWEVNQRDHRKIMIIDGRIAFLGGINIASVYAGSFSADFNVRSGTVLPWRDTDLRLEGPVVAELQKLFIEAWNQQHGAPLAARHYFPPLQPKGKEVVRAIGSSPEDPYSLIYVTLISALRSAQSEIWLTNGYFAPDPQLLAALKDAVKRGVDVRLLLPGHTDSWLVFYAGRAYYHELLEAGVKLYLRRDALLHVKSAVIDGVWSTVGSTNLDWRSFLHNYEVNAVVLGNDFGDRMRAAFLADLAQSRQLTLEQWRRRGLDERAKEVLGRLWEYWL